MLTRRSIVAGGLISFVAAPAIVRAGSLMPVKQMLPRGDVPHVIVVPSRAFKDGFGAETLEQIESYKKTSDSDDFLVYFSWDA
jgi:hypothetical protein